MICHNSKKKSYQVSVKQTHVTRFRIGGNPIDCSSSSTQTSSIKITTKDIVKIPGQSLKAAKDSKYNLRYGEKAYMIPMQHSKFKKAGTLPR
jgi:hypothetical protein